MNTSTIALDGSAVAWAPPGESTSSSKRVLVVDDDERFRTAIIRFLDKCGWNCSGVSSGKAASDRARDEQFDLALVDCWMPEMSGFETLASLKKADPCLSVVLISAMGTESTKREALKQGAVDFVGKELPPDQIEEALGRQVKQAVVRQRLFDAQENPLCSFARGTVLLVDDHDGYRRAAARRMKKAGFCVKEAACGSSAIDLGERGGIDAAIIDLHLPDTNGIEVARILRALRPTMAVALISGEANQAEKARAITCGLMGCISKSDSQDRLVKVAGLLVKQTRESRRAEKRALLPPESWSTRFGQACNGLLKKARRSMSQREARVVVAGLVVAVLVAISAMNVLARHELSQLEMSQLEMGAPQARRSMSFVDMYDRIAGYLERDEQRETKRRPAAGNEAN